MKYDMAIHFPYSELERLYHKLENALEETGEGHT
mgnify:CR=1 FL=1